MKHILTLAAIALFGCGPQREWQGWVYPDAENDVVGISLAGFETFKQCQEAAIGMVRSLDEPDKASYECGRQCRWDETYRANICKETRN